MPNWVYNTLDVIGKPEEVNEFINFMNTGYTVKLSHYEGGEDGTALKEIIKDYEHKSIFNFHALLPIPTDPKLYDDQKLEDGLFIQPWYNWNIANWGTKWNARDISLERMGEGEAVYNFSTAWSPPMPIIDRLRKLFPTTTFFFRYQEEQGWGGEVTIRSGSVVHTEEWDIPANHAEYERRQGECICSFESDEEYWFSDCKELQVTANEL
jgi:hypothetical protein